MDKIFIRHINKEVMNDKANKLAFPCTVTVWQQTKRIMTLVDICTKENDLAIKKQTTDRYHRMLNCKSIIQKKFKRLHNYLYEI